jgi:ribosomal protein S18 acetylase RimI-like enzyme
MSDPITLSKAARSDWPAIWLLLEPVFRAGETYAVDRDIAEDAAQELWMGGKAVAYVAKSEDGEVLGTYYLKPNFGGPASGVSNCGYIVAPAARGRGVAALMCRHSQGEAVDAGFRAMQFNCVVAENRQAIRIWEREGFTIVGTLAHAFDHPCAGLTDAHIMYKQIGAEGGLIPHG